MNQWIAEHRRTVAAIVALGLVGAIVAVVWFQPQKLFIDERVDEALPGLDAQTATTNSPTPATTPTAGTTPTAPPTGAGGVPAGEVTTTAPTRASSSTTTTPTTSTTTPSLPTTLHSSEFIEIGHAGTGNVIVVELPDGSRVIRFENLDVTNGPDLRVILSRSPLVDDRNAYDDGEFLDLGPLKGNQGNQNYDVPDGADLDGYLTVAIWCRRFNYTFNAATITS